ncbi:conjugal transfer protein TraN [Escherichia coli]|uniref:conjugal transfer protein TraN n=1 Tax=Escherichia coli TaxID=562 RepID=UPI000B7C9642|nr:conjugal transfer protein TraN [Escherichia coli]
MASINTIVKRKQYLWLGIVVVGTASAIGGALYLSDVDMSGNGETVAEQEPVPDMTGVVDTTFDDKVRQHATTEMQVTAAQMQKQYEEIRRELDVLNKQRGDDQRRIEKLGQDNAALAEQVKALGANPVTATGEPVPQMPASPPGPEGEPQPGNTPVSFPPQGSVAVPPPTAFYPGNGVTPPPQVASRQCAFYSDEGTCLHEYAIYSCESKTSGKVMVCGGDVFCLDGECDKAQSGKSSDFGEAVSQLAALAAAGKDVAALNGVDVRAFTGEAKFCRKAAAGFSNCCKDGGWGQDVGLAKCNSEEKALGKAKDNKLTVSVGEFCSKKVLGVCLQKKRSYCQFDSKLAQIVQQQGRNGQLRIGFGSAKSPDCRGITVDELQRIKFDQLDFTNFYEDLMNNQKIPDSGVLTQKVKEQIADQLKQAGQ